MYYYDSKWYTFTESGGYVGEWVYLGKYDSSKVYTGNIIYDVYRLSVLNIMVSLV